MNIELSPQMFYTILFLSIYNGIFIGLAIAVFYQNRRSMTNRYFAIFLLVIIFWFNLTFIYTNLFFLPHIFYPLGLIAGTFLAPAFYFFSRHLTDESYRVRKLEYLGLIPLAVIVGYNVYCLFSPEFRESITEIIKVVNGTVSRKANWGYFLYTIYLFTGIFSGLFFIIRGIRRESDSAKKKRLIYILIPIIIGFLVSVIFINILTILKLPVNMTIPYITITIALIFVGFSLLRHRAWTVEYMMDLISEKEEKLALSYEQLKSLDKMKSDFFTNLSHEMKTPLTLISNYVESYIEGHGTSEEISIIKKNIDKLLGDMINFFDIQKFERGINIYDHDTIIDLSDVLKQKVDIYRSMAKRMDISITDEIEEPLYLKADSAAIERVINNLMDNAIRYNKKQGSILVSLTASEDKLKLTIRDTGIGIDSREIDHIFKPYYQISYKKKNIQGIGMGLYLVKKTIDSLNGEITVNSIPGTGSEFTIFLKRYHLNAGEHVIRENLSVKTIDSLPYYTDTLPEASRTGGITLLIVEDNRDLLHLLLKRLGARYRVFGATNGKKALELLMDVPVPDVIISDIMMDEMDGIEFCSTITKDTRFHDVPFIFLTARSHIDDRIDGLKLGAIDYIYKPFVVEELISKIEAILRYRELKNTLYEKERFASLGMLLGGISHEILNPLSGITGPLSNLGNLIQNSGLREDTHINKYLDQIRESAARIKNVVNNIRVCCYDKTMEMTEVSVLGVIKKVVTDYKDKHKTIRFFIQVDKKLTITANREAFYRIVSNLLANAIDAVDGNGTIVLSAGREDGSVVFKITDSGRGIPQDRLGYIFNAFYTTKKVGQGSGLGLNIVKNLCLKHCWDIRVESEKGKGTTFVITIAESKDTKT
jgi:signal transduction histidine kinase